MMKISYLYLTFILLLFSDCIIHKKIEYNIPTDIQGKKKDELLASLEKGRKLYQQVCADCHGIFSKGKDGIPNFTNQQIDNYTSYVIKKDPKNHAVAAKLDPEQFHEVVMFLRCRKINGDTTHVQK